MFGPAVYSRVDIIAFMIGDNIVMNWLFFKKKKPVSKFQICNLTEVMNSKGR